MKGVLLIGLCRGASLAIWADFFPSARVYGVDINTSRVNLTALRFFRGLPRHVTDRVEVFSGDSTVPIGFPGALMPTMPLVDLVIDDGDHRHESIVAGFNNMFLRILRPGGLWIIEDTNHGPNGVWAGSPLEELFRQLLAAVNFEAPGPDVGPGGSRNWLIDCRLAATWDPLVAWVEAVEFHRNVMIVRKRRAALGVSGRTWRELAADINMKT